MGDVLDSRLLALTALVTIGFQALFFLITYALRFDKLTDFAGSTNFIILTVITLTVGSEYEWRSIVVSSFVIVWGVRLCAFLLYRILLWGEDRRFDDKRDNFVNLSVFWALQAVWVWTVSLPVTLLNTSGFESGRRWNGVDVFGWVLFGTGLILESVADQQKLLYKRREESRGRWTDVGVWSYSRHPNYFGEMIVWWGVYLSCVQSLQGAAHGAVIGPIFITLLLMFVSGIPLLERSANEKHGEKEEYVEYKKRTSVLIPIPPSLYKRFNEGVKKTILLDFAFYGRGGGESESGRDLNN